MPHKRFQPKRSQTSGRADGKPPKALMPEDEDRLRKKWHGILARKGLSTHLPPLPKKRAWRLMELNERRRRDAES